MRKSIGEQVGPEGVALAIIGAGCLSIFAAPIVWVLRRFKIVRK